MKSHKILLLFLIFLYLFFPLQVQGYQTIPSYTGFQSTEVCETSTCDIPSELPVETPALSESTHNLYWIFYLSLFLLVSLLVIFLFYAL
jgi:hypothetical protein